MKKLLGMLLIAGSLAACNNSADSTSEAKDSIDSAAKVQTNNVDSAADVKTDAIDSAAKAKTDAIDSTADAKKAAIDSTHKK